MKVGDLHVLGRVPAPAQIAEASTKDPSAEAERFRRQVDALEQEIGDAVERLESEAFLGEAEILRTHLAMLKDPDLHDQVLGLIRDTRLRAEAAVEQALETMAEILGGAKDPVLAERAVDFGDLAMRLSSRLSDQSIFDLGRVADGSLHAVLAVRELLPSLVLEARDQDVAGFIVESGTPLSEGAILAKSFGMPVVRLTSLDAVRPHLGWLVLVAGDDDILIDPTNAELDARRPADDMTVPFSPVAGAPRVRVWGSIVDPAQLTAVDWTGIEGVGLYRSETLFMRHRDNFPGEAEQYVAYRRLFELAGSRPVVFRTVDLVQYLFAVERNTANVADFYQPAHPVVLQVIHDLAQQAANAGKPFGICGEVAADEAMLPVLVGLGLRDFSVAPSVAYSVNRRLHALNEEACEWLARECLAAHTGDEVGKFQY